MILSSHANPAITNYLPRKHFSDVFKHKFVFLQHGITKDDQSEWLNSRNISHLVTAAYPEFSDISNDGRYKYTTKETILSGFPRYDALYGKSINSKVILIMPTWRKSLTGEFIGKTSQRAKNPNFSTSQFCKMWGGLLGSESLKSLAEHHGYEVMYYPHPNLNDYKDDLGIPSYINIVDPQKQSIQEVFKRTSVLVTDFSSVAFDISYMNKSILYFQFDTDTFFAEHSYSKGYFDYEKHGFGPIVSNISDAIYELKLILKNQCNPAPNYQKRISDFFPYNDDKNSERLYHSLIRKGSNSAEFSSLERKIHHLADKFDTNSLTEFITENKSKISVVKDYELTIFRRMIFSLYIISALMKSSELTEVIIKISQTADSGGCYKWVHDNEHITALSLNDLLTEVDSGLFSSNIINPVSIYTSTNVILTKISLLISDYKNQNYQDCVSRAYSLFSISDLKFPREIELAIIKSLLNIGDLSKASRHAQLINLNESEKSEICEILINSGIDFNQKQVQVFISRNLAITTQSTDSHIEFILSHGDANKVNYDELINSSRLSTSIVNNYIKQAYKNNDHQTLSKMISENEIIEKISRSDENITYRLFNDFIVNGLDSFLSSLLSLSEVTGFEESLERLVVKNAHLDLATFYDIIENSISQYSELFSCSYLYKISFMYHKFNKPNLAKKLISHYLMVQHEIFFSQPHNWGTENDYQILIKAASELNKIKEV